MDPQLIQFLLDYANVNPDVEGMTRTAVPELALFRQDKETPLMHALYRPTICINIQGSKEVQIEERTYHYREMQYLVVRMDLPILARIREATPERPYLALAIDIDLELLREVAQQMELTPSSALPQRSGVSFSDSPPQLVAAISRLAGLLQTTEAIPILKPLAIKEIYYWMLRAPQNSDLVQLAMPNGNAVEIAEAVRRIRRHLAEPIRVEQLADLAKMSRSTFHAHFKAATSMTPVQYQKRLRLMEARSILLTSTATATEAAFKVGYESVSQFSREYTRMFGASPRRDLAHRSAS